MKRAPAPTRSDASIPSRYRTVPRAEKPMTRIVGLCRFCHREMWRGAQIDPGMVVVAADGKTCSPCQRYTDEHPDVDPRDVYGAAAEQIPQERRETDPSWRQLDKRCAGVDPDLFAPDPDPDEDDVEPLAMNGVERAQRRHDTARRFCEPCPARAGCRATALERSYEGVWGRLFIERTKWVDLVTGEDGLTVHASTRQREVWAARQARRAVSAAASDAKPVAA